MTLREIEDRRIVARLLCQALCTPRESEDQRVIALRLYEALCAKFPDKHIALIQPPAAPADQSDRRSGLS
jgi:hypothetical protein